MNSSGIQVELNQGRIPIPLGHNSPKNSVHLPQPVVVLLEHQRGLYYTRGICSGGFCPNTSRIHLFLYLRSRNISEYATGVYILQMTRILQGVYILP